MKAFTEHSNICNNLKRIHQTLLSYQKTSHMSNLSSYIFSVSELVKKARQSFRQSKGINQENYIIAIAPGETSK